jgi:ferric-dicitrate binding protein FerR (iron transport regulator)
MEKKDTGDNLQGMPTIHEELEVKRCMNRRFVTAPDTGAAWEAFSRNYLDKEENDDVKEPCRETPKSHISAKILWRIVASAAAVIAVLIVFNWNHLGRSDKHLFYEAKDDIAQVTLTDVSGNKTVVDQQKIIMSQQQNQTTVGKSQENASEIYNKILHLVTSHGKTCEITLEDGTTIWLNDESALDFPEHFSPTKREVKVSGEAYFDVAKDAKRPFIVKGEGFETRVLGTQFNIKSRSANTTKTSDPVTEITLVEGSICVTDDKGMEQRLLPGQQYFIKNGQWNRKEVDTYPITQWREGFFYFDQTSLGDILTDVGRWYNINVVLEKPELMDIILHFVAEKSQSIEEVVTSLNMLKVAQITLEDNKIVVRE